MLYIKYSIEYSSRETCRTCPNRRTDSMREKHVNIGRNSTYVPVIMYGDSRYPLQQIPDIVQPDRYNSFGKLKSMSSPSWNLAEGRE